MWKMHRPLGSTDFAERVSNASGWLLDLAAPPRCVACDRPIPVPPASTHPFCAPCDRTLPRWRRIDGCPRCGTRRDARPTTRPWSQEDTDAFDSPESGNSGEACLGCLSSGSPLHACHSLLRYEGAVRRWVPAFKRPIAFARPFGPPARIRAAIDGLSARLAESLAREVAPNLDFLVPIPLHPRRQRTRGFNPVEPIAAGVARGLGLPCHHALLVRTRPTAPQASLSGKARRRNLRSAFAWRGGSIEDQRIGLVDDVLTTGSTLEAAADVLLEAGALEVRALTIAATRPRLRDDARRRRIQLPRDGEC